MGRDKSQPKLMEMFASAFRTVTKLYLIPEDLFYVTVNGKIADWKSLEEGIHFQVHFRLRGGKGGFGSLLRSFRIHRSTNQLMCRDLSGRRLADIKEEEKLRKWIEKAGEREEEKRRQKQEKYEKLKAGPRKHDFSDPDFIQTREKIMEETDKAFEEGIAVAKSKRNNGEDSLKSKQDSRRVEDTDSNKETVPKRRRITLNETVECVIPKLNDESLEKLIKRLFAALLIAEKSHTIVEKASSEVLNFDINLDDYDSAENWSL
ncbi:Thioredoxin-related transmembrane protein 1 [Dirofilaria immitis]|nr:Thioredoxin-related transmembrane protein 1 [Dirofilaria immitis]